MFRPLIWVINEASNRLLRLLGLTPEEFGETTHDVTELKHIVASAARAGQISVRQSQLAHNVFGIIGLEARHILVPRVDVQYLSLQRTFEENLAVIREGGHSRYPLCENDLDTVIGIVHTRDLFQELQSSPPVADLRAIAREVVFVPETQPLSRVIVTMQNHRSHVVVVIDEHRSSVGLTFLEDALEQIVGPLADEFDVEESTFQETGRRVDTDGRERPPCRKPVELLGLADVSPDAEPETIAGLITAELGRLPRVGDTVPLGRFTATVDKVARRRIQWLLLTPRLAEAGSGTKRDPHSSS